MARFFVGRSDAKVTCSSSVDENSASLPPAICLRRTSVRTIRSCPVLPRKVEKIFANLTNSQVNLLRQSWKTLFTHRERHGTNIMKRTEAKRPETTNLFCKAALIGWLSATTIQLTLGEQSQSQTNDRQPAEDRKASSGFNAHARLLIYLFDFVVSNVKDANAVIGYLKQVGGQHAVMHESGLRAAYWESFGEAAMEVIGSADGVQQSKETVKTWRLVIASVTHQVRLGFECELRRRREQANGRRNSVPTQTQDDDMGLVWSRPRSRSRQKPVGDWN